MRNSPVRTLGAICALAVFACNKETGGAGERSARTPLEPVEAAAAAIAAPAAAVGTALNLSDIHFDPFYGLAGTGSTSTPNAELTTLITALFKDDPSAWDADLKASTAQSGANSVQHAHNGHYDSNYALLSSGLDAAAKAAPSPDFIVITGDFLAHNFVDGYASVLAANPHLTVTPPQKGCAAAVQDKDGYEIFVCKTMQYVAMQLKQRFPNTPIYAALGNNDSYKGDYEIDPGGSYLVDMAAVWQTWFLPSLSPADQSAFTRDFTQGGYFSLPLPTTSPGRIIVLSTSMFSAKNSQGGAVSTAANAQLNPWLSGLLASAKGKEALWIAGHIAPGLDGYSDTESWQNSKTSPYDSTYASLVSGARGEIAAQLFGHTHMQEFKLFGATGATPYGFLHIGPGLTPWNGNNSAFQVLSYDKTSLGLADYSTWYIDNANPKASWGAAPASFQGAYNKTGATMTDRMYAVYTDLSTGVAATQSTYNDRYEAYVPKASVNGGFSTYCPTMLVDPAAPAASPP